MFYIYVLYFTLYLYYICILSLYLFSYLVIYLFATAKNFCFFFNFCVNSTYSQQSMRAVLPSNIELASLVRKTHHSHAYQRYGHAQKRWWAKDGCHAWVAAVVSVKICSAEGWGSSDVNIRRNHRLLVYLFIFLFIYLFSRLFIT